MQRGRAVQGPGRNRRRKERTHRCSTISTIGFAAGFVALGAGVALVLTSHDGSKTALAPKSRPERGRLPTIDLVLTARFRSSGGASRREMRAGEARPAYAARRARIPFDDERNRDVDDELGERLSAHSARRPCRGPASRDRDGDRHALSRCDHLGDGAAFGAERQSIRCILDIAAGEHPPRNGDERAADSVVRVRRVRVLPRGDGSLLEGGPIDGRDSPRMSEFMQSPRRRGAPMPRAGRRSDARSLRRGFDLRVIELAGGSRRRGS